MGWHSKKLPNFLEEFKVLKRQHRLIVHCLNILVSLFIYLNKQNIYIQFKLSIIT